MVSYDKLVDELAHEIKGKKIIPFVGAGLSRNLGLPEWDVLMARVAEDLDIEPDILALHGDFLQIAEYHIICHGGSKNRISKIIDRNLRSIEVDISASVAHKCLIDMKFPKIYTTNFDEMIEMAFRYHKEPHYTIATLDDILEAPDNITQIVKFHGTLDLDETLVISETDYHNRLDMEGPLDIKLRSDLLGKTVLFLGYSFRDLNIRYMWSKLFRVMQENCKAYMVTMKPNYVFDTVYGKKGMKIICLDSDDFCADFTAFMEDLRDRVLRD
ncbi:SIR2-like domain-containing protein [Desulfotomaculum arcticum]|uniref:SIR2-like domain-containing protein n=1 Tax=Desulfotruncus arcticus DSM 17038 TaxID=1121424 RepID=A0A1I2TBD8_9FIRM|nr:SIR2 family protein [Desulfotruncus arcticus]SFG62140.1 SIR2-like domain-containing protein [Desulfotomaculum arcticum] [Desulfotruncus arcticus DSM 17038]